LQGELTNDSTDEQSSAGLDQCTAEELSRFQQLNAAYQARFDMPFIMAVRGSNRHQILAGFAERLANEPAVEFERALSEINRIARLRLQTLSSPAYPRDMIGYGNHPPQAQWPEKARIAVQFVINYEEGGENCILHGDRASEAFLSEIVGAQALEGVRHMNMESIYEYGSRVGFWRLHKLFTQRNLPVTVFGVAMALERNPDAVAAMQSADWEIASHGYRWIDYQYMDEAEEREHLRKAIAVHTRVTGQRPTGWYLGRCSPNTHRMVAEEGGFAYNADSYADDLPYWDATYGDKPQLIVPYTLDANDMRFASPQGFNAGDQFFNYLKDSFDTLYAEGLDTPRMLSIGLHCRLVGRPGRIASLARFLDYIKSFDDAWVARRIDIAEHWRQHHPAAN
jgi:putative urate catabolism protein